MVKIIDTVSGGQSKVKFEHDAQGDPLPDMFTPWDEGGTVNLYSKRKTGPIPTFKDTVNGQTKGPKIVDTVTGSRKRR